MRVSLANGCGTCSGKFIEAAADVAPAESELDIIALGQRPVSGVAIDLQDAGEGVEMTARALGLAVRQIDIGQILPITTTLRPVNTGRISSIQVIAPPRHCPGGRQFMTLGLLASRTSKHGRSAKRWNCKLVVPLRLITQPYGPDLSGKND